jgi:hypothetical protein
MRRPLRFALAFILSLLISPFLPLYIERTMMRSMLAGRAGDVIEWGWGLCTLKGYWSNYSYYRPEQKPALWLGLNLALALIYSLLIAFVVDKVFSWRKRRRAG